MATDGILSFEDGQITLGGELLPGVFRRLNIRGQVRFDEAKQDGLSGKVKVPLGWEDMDVTAEVDLLTDDDTDCYDKLASLDAIFRGYDSAGNPKVYDLVNRHASARGLDQVVFAGLDSSETDQDDVIAANLAFQEHQPAVVAVESRVAASDAAKGAGAPGVDPGEDDEPPLVIDLG
ncbi:MAG: hypothetical protein PWQ57_915 [Desulfovibrionales bacterium]|nr:hypothetical protein [Desulfovibrionales bacterium]